jgi:hypothetical protein
MDERKTSAADFFADPKNQGNWRLEPLRRRENPMTTLSPEARYDRDPAFRQLVDTLYGFIVMADYTPTELREAVLLAAIRYEQRHTESWVAVKD